jgi:hypothetical protein
MINHILTPSVLCIILTISSCFSDDELHEEAVITSVGFTATIKADQKKVSVSEDIVVTFNATVDPSTVTSSSLYLVENNSDVIVSEVFSSNVIDQQCLTNLPITGHITCADDNLSCALSLDTDLSFNTDYFLCLLDSIKLAEANSGAFVGDSIGFQTIGKYTVSGSVSGLTGEIILQNNSADDVTLTGDGTFTFATSVIDDTAFKVTIKSQPSNLTCSVGNGSGTINGATISDVSVTCSTNAYSVSGTLTGLAGTVILQNNAGDDLILAADGSFSFDTNVADGAIYAVTILTQPTGQTCTVTQGEGTISSSDVAAVAVSCVNLHVGGTISGLSGTLVLQNNNGDNLTLTTNGVFTFSTTFLTTLTSTYSVSILSEPVIQTCTVANATGTIGSSNVSNITVVCRTRVIYAGTSNGLSISTDGGASFVTKTTDNGLGGNNISFVEVSSDGTKLYLATNGGISISTNSGNSFITKNNANSGIDNDQVNFLFIQGDGSRIYLGTQAGLSISTDSGVSFITKNNANSGLADDTVRGVYASENGTTLYVGTTSGLSISTDSGNSFITKNNANSGLANGGIFQVLFNAAISKLYVATISGLSISTDLGTSFVTKTTADGLANNACVFVQDNEDGTKVYVSSNNFANAGGFSTSKNSSKSFTSKTSANGLAGDLGWGFDVKDDGKKLYVGTQTGLSISTDSGETFVTRTTDHGLGSNAVQSVVVY